MKTLHPDCSPRYPELAGISERSLQRRLTLYQEQRADPRSSLEARELADKRCRMICDELIARHQEASAK